MSARVSRPDELTAHDADVRVTDKHHAEGIEVRPGAVGLEQRLPPSQVGSEVGCHLEGDLGGRSGCGYRFPKATYNGWNLAGLWYRVKGNPQRHR
jgi:hypothetical protein